MSRVKLTPGLIRKATCPTGVRKTDLFDTKTPGFLVEVRASGGKTYYQRYTAPRGGERQIRLGLPAFLPFPKRRRRDVKL